MPVKINTKLVSHKGSDVSDREKNIHEKEQTSGTQRRGQRRIWGLESWQDCLALRNRGQMVTCSTGRMSSSQVGPLFKLPSWKVILSASGGQAGTGVLLPANSLGKGLLLARGPDLVCEAHWPRVGSTGQTPVYPTSTSAWSQTPNYSVSFFCCCLPIFFSSL